MCSFLRRKRHTIPLFFFSFPLREGSLTLAERQTKQETTGWGGGTPHETTRYRSYANLTRPRTTLTPSLAAAIALLLYAESGTTLW